MVERVKKALEQARNERNSLRQQAYSGAPSGGEEAGSRQSGTGLLLYISLALLGCSVVAIIVLLYVVLDLNY